MSLETNLQSLINAFVTDVRDISNSIAGVANAKNATVQGTLNTTAKNLTDAINELFASINGLDTDDVAEGSELYFTQARVLASVLTGYAAAAGTVSATATVLSALQKIAANVQAIDLTNVIDDVSPGTTTTYSSSKIDSDIAAAVASLVDTSPGALDTLNELAAAIGDDENFAATITTSLGLKANIADTKSTTELGATVDTHNYASDYTTARDA